MNDRMIDLFAFAFVLIVCIYFWKITLVLMAISTILGFILFSFIVARYYYFEHKNKKMSESNTIQ